MPDEMISFGSEVKALGDGKVGGYIVRFTSPNEPDLVGDYFDAKSDLDLEDGDKVSLYYDHGRDATLKARRFGRAPVQIQDAGVWLEHKLDLRDKYEKALYQLAEMGKLGFSTGPAQHLIEREAKGNVDYMVRWPVKEASFSVIPMDFRSNVFPLKSLPELDLKSLIGALEPEPETPPEPQASADVERTVTGDTPPTIQVSEVHTMPDNGQPTPAQPAPDATPAPATAAPEYATKAEIKSLSDMIEKLIQTAEDTPAVRRGGFYTNDGGDADKNVKSALDMLLAIKRHDEKRLLKHYGLKAQVEDGGITGGYFVPDAVLADLLPQLTLTSGLGSLVRRIPVPSPAGTAPIRDYSRVPTASVGQSASAMGSTSQTRAEGGAYVEETIFFEMLKWNVTDFASGFFKMSKELQNDAPMIQNMLQEAIREDVANREEWAILRGTGVGMPLGVLNWAGLGTRTEAVDNTFGVADSDSMVSKLLQAPGARIAWVHHHGVYTNIAAFERGTGGAVYQSNISGALSTALHGYPRLNSQHLPAQGTNGYVVLGDWSRYFVFEYGGLYIDYSEHADFLNGNNVWRFGKRIDGKPAMTAAVTLADASFTLSPFVALNNLS